MATVGAIFGGCNWGHNDIDIDVNKAVNIDRNFNSNRNVNRGEGGRTNWQHDPSHRKGVAYRDQGTRNKYAAGTPGADARRDYRGHAGGAGQPQVGGGARDRGPGGGGQPELGGGARDRGPGASTMPAGPGGGRPDARGDSGGAFTGVGAGAQTQRDSQRGHASTQSLGASRASAGSRPSAGASRPSGGARAGGARSGGGGRRR